ncbi:MAG: restriction endonuclease subunit S, partial [Prevotellaceae bacterium]|nr:restriction endonuclease subunit S [Prevotellaceae bacterium]
DGNSYNDQGNGIIFYQGATDFGSRFPQIRQYTTKPARLAKQGDILLSVRAPVGAINIANNDCCIGRGLVALNSKANTITYLYEAIKTLKQIFDRRNIDGTTFGAIAKDDLFSLNVIDPDNSILDNFHLFVYPMFIRMNILEQENQSLASLRDFLLPMLMNGQVTVKTSKKAKK